MWRLTRLLVVMQIISIGMLSVMLMGVLIKALFVGWGFPCMDRLNKTKLNTNKLRRPAKLNKNKLQQGGKHTQEAAKKATESTTAQLIP